MSLENPDGGDPPKVEAIVSEADAPRETARAMLGRFLLAEQEERQKLRDEYQLGSTWQDLANAYNSISQSLMMSPRNLDVDGSESFQVTNLDAGGGADMMYDTFSGESSSKRANFAAIKGEGSDRAERKRAKKEAKKEKKRAKKEQKKEAKKHAKLMMNNPF